MTTTHRRIALLTGASISAIGLSALAATPAEAACTLVGTVLTCGTTTTTDTVYPTNPPNDRGYDAPIGLTTATVTAGSTVDGFGLAFNAPTNSYTVTNNGTIQTNAGNTPSVGIASALSLWYDNTNSNVNYSGTGNIINLGTGAGLLGNDVGSGAGTFTANIGGSVRADNGDAIHVGGGAGSGAITITTVAGQTVRSSAGSGINVSTAGTSN